MMCFRTDTFFFTYFLPRVLSLRWNEVFKLTPSEFVGFSNILHTKIEQWHVADIDLGCFIFDLSMVLGGAHMGF